MTFREDLARGCQRFLEPGEKIRYVLLGKTTPLETTWMAFALWAYLVHDRQRVVCVTDRTVMIFSADYEGNPKRVLLRHGREQVPRLMSDMAGEVAIGRRRIRIYSDFSEDLGAADAELRRLSRGGSIPPQPIRVRYELE